MASRQDARLWLQQDDRHGTSSLAHPLRSLLAGRTDDLILKADARHHQAIRQVSWRGWEAHLVSVHIKNGSAQATHRVIMVLRRPVDAQAVTWTAHTATQPGADEHIERLIDRGKGQGRMVLTECVIEMLRRGMRVVLFECGQDHHPWTSCLEPCSVQSCHSLGHGSYPLNRNDS